MTRPNPTLERLEHVNDTLARAVDKAEDQSELLLAKIAFYMGARTEDITLFDEAIDTSLKDLTA